MTILGAGIALVFGLLSGTLRLAAGSRDASETAIYAGQRLEEALLRPDPAEGMERGTFGDKYRWELATSILPLEAVEEGEEGEEEPYDEIRLRVTIHWMDGGDERSVEVGATRWMRREKDEDA